MPKRTRAIIAVVVVIFMCGQCYGSDTMRLSEAEIDAKLFELKPLPKVHYSFTGLGGNLMDMRNSRRLYDYARITHSLTVSGEWVKQKRLDNCVYTCARINKTNPKIPASIGAGFYPWIRKMDKSLPPTYRGPGYYEEISYFSERLKLIKKWLAESNKKYNSNVKLSAILLDTEHFTEHKGDNEWNEAVREALDAIHIQAKSIFPNARIEWYGRGIGAGAGSTGWGKTPWWTGKEIKPSLSCSLYSVFEIERTRETFRRTCKLADQMGVSDVTPWVALASGYRRGLKKFNYFDRDYSYDIIYSYMIGAELNIRWYGDRTERFAPYNRAKVVVFYPPAFNDRTPDWAKHFIAYVRGATGVQDLKDLGYEGK